VRAQGDLDTPDVQISQAKPSSVRLMLTAGPTGAPAGFAVEWMKKSDFDAAGGWPAANDPSVIRGTFTGTPTFNVQGTDDSYALSGGANIEVELGQLFDETGVLATQTEELEPSTRYAVRVRAIEGAGANGSAWSQTYVVETGGPSTNCTYTIGYWKTHPGAWPVSSLMVGCVNYSATQLLAILNQPAGGNGLLILMHQLIAAKLNILNGADPTVVAGDIAAAEALICGLVPPPVGSDYLAPSLVNTLSNKLDDYNNGLIGPGHCGTVPATPSTWGQLKSTYRQ
jgi:hypothetical protein